VSNRQIATQNGAALFVSLIMLLLITLLAVSSMQSSIVQEKMTANQYDSQIAFQAAEAALRRGELLRQGQAGFVSLPIGPAPAANKFLDNTLWQATAIQVALPAGSGVAKAPEVVTEELDFDSNNNTSRIRVTARGYGARETTVVVLQSIVAL